MGCRAGWMGGPDEVMEGVRSGMDEARLSSELRE
jgi:hypothetical protein